MNTAHVVNLAESRVGEKALRSIGLLKALALPTKSVQRYFYKVGIQPSTWIGN